MIDAQTVQELYRYNRWANARVFDTVAAGGGYPSIRETLTHIVWGEWLWLQRWKGKSPQVVFTDADFPRLDSLKARWREVDLEQTAFVESLTEDALRSTVRYVNLQGQTWQYQLWRQLYHVVNHSTYHRGQVTMMLRQSGARPVATDFLVFHDELDDFTLSV